MRAAGRVGAACAALLGLAGCQTSQPQRCTLARATELPLRFDGAHLLVDAVLNGTPTSLIFDTGSDSTVISTQAADRLSLPLIPAGQYFGVGGAGRAYVFLTRSFQLGALHGRQLRLVASDMVMGGGAGAPDGLLGDNFLSAYDIDLDLAGRRAVLYVATACVRPSAALPQPLYTAPMLSRPADDLHPTVEVVIANQHLVAALDTGAPHSAIFSDAAHRLGLDIAHLTDDLHFRAHGVGPDAPAAVRHVIASMGIGEVSVRDVPVAIIDQPSVRGVDMLLGLDFLTRVHAWFSFSSHTLIMQYPPLPSAMQ